MRSNNSERVLALVFVLCAGATAQWLTFREPGAPRTPNGQADLIASPPMEPSLKRAYRACGCTRRPLRLRWGACMAASSKFEAPHALAALLRGPPGCIIA